MAHATVMKAKACFSYALKPMAEITPTRKKSITHYY